MLVARCALPVPVPLVPMLVVGVLSLPAMVYAGHLFLSLPEGSRTHCHSHRSHRHMPCSYMPCPLLSLLAFISFLPDWQIGCQTRCRSPHLYGHIASSLGLF
jgi:hypothetical protein